MQHIRGLFYQKMPDACVDDITPPSFLGINNLTDLPNGSLRAEWSPATDSTNPIRYEIYVQATTSVGLFNTTNIAYVSYGDSLDIYQLANGDRLAKDVIYYVGIRAVDAVGNRETNTISMNIASAGVLDDDLATIAASLVSTKNDLDVIADRVELAANLTIAKVL